MVFMLCWAKDLNLGESDIMYDWDILSDETFVDLKSENSGKIVIGEENLDVNNPGATGNISIMEVEKVKEYTRKPPKVPIRTNITETGVIYNVDFFDVVSDISYYIKFIALLEESSESDTFYIRVASPGGSVNIGGIIGSLLRKTKATTIGVSIGQVASIAMYIWSNCKYQVVMPGSLFLFHMSSHGDHGISTHIKARSKEIVEYALKYLLRGSLEKGHLLESEYKTIKEKSLDITISSNEMKRRCNEAGCLWDMQKGGV